MDVTCWKIWAWKDVSIISRYLLKIVMDEDDTLNTTIEELQKILSAKNITGDPIEMEDKIVLPITKIGMGFGAGSQRGSENKNNDEAASRAGGGIGVFPVAIVIVFKGVEGPEGIKVVPLSKPSAPLEFVGKISSAFKEGFEGKRESAEKKRDDLHVISIDVE